MNQRELKQAFIPNRDKHPERTLVSYRRLQEVLINVSGDSGEEFFRNLTDKVSPGPGMDLIEKDQVDSVIEFLTDVLSQEQLNDLYTQLIYSEFSTLEAIEIHEKYKIPVSHLEKDIIPVKGDGCWIIDTKGDRYLDMDSNYSATNLGMNNEEIAKGLYNQAVQLISMKEDRVQIPRTRFLKEIHDMMPEGMNYFYWQNSGGEAVDKCIKIAKAFTESRDVIAFKNGFHGRTHGAVAVTFNKKYREPFGLDKEDWVHFAEFNNLEDFKKVQKETGSKIVILEMVQGEEAGNLPGTEEFIKGLWEYCRENEIVIIDDEVQAGFGRSAIKPGDWFACMSYNVVPDIMSIGKSFGGGYPVTAVVTTEKIANKMKPGYDGSTFGGNPMAMVAARIATRQMRERKVTENVIARNKQFKEGFEKLKKKHEVFEEYRGMGLMLSFSLTSPENVKKMHVLLKDLGVKTSLSTGKFFRILPPTVINQEEVQFFLDKLDKALAKL